MSYSNVPLSGQSLGNTRVPINTNFSLIQSTISVNHFPISATNAGKHKFIQMPNTTAPATAATEGALYTAQANGTTQLFWRKQSSGTSFQLTGVDITTALEGHTFLPGGLILNWGQKSGVNSGDTINWQKPFTTFYSGTLTRKMDGITSRAYIQFLGTTPPTATQFTVTILNEAGTALNNQTIFWIAIGLA